MVDIYVCLCVREMRVFISLNMFLSVLSKRMKQPIASAAFKLACHTHPQTLGQTVMFFRLNTFLSILSKRRKQPISYAAFNFACHTHPHTLGQTVMFIGKKNTFKGGTNCEVNAGAVLILPFPLLHQNRNVAYIS